MAKEQSTSDDIIPFLRQRDYKFVRELGYGSCGKTVLLHDDQIDEHFVCKKYSPLEEASRQELFNNFIREVKLLHRVHHPNVVRVFNYYLYPEQYAGFLLMEHVDGVEIDAHLKENPQQASDLFIQAVAGFSYLERSKILHRDIRPGNIMVGDDAELKIIDLGFGKEVKTSDDFGKSISLNWWCETPLEFQQGRYDFATEVYFVGKLFEGIIQDNGIDHFKYREVLRSMCHRDPDARIASFQEVEQSIGKNQFNEIGFTEEELSAYRAFASGIRKQITKIKSAAKYQTDLPKIRAQLSEVYQGFMLEEKVPDCSSVLRCFILGRYHLYRQGLPVVVVRDFLRLLKSLTDERGKIVLANLHTAFDAIPHYEDPPIEEVPF